MAEESITNQTDARVSDRQRGVDEVALEMMKFITLTTGYGKPSSTGTGFAGKANRNTTDEYADALLQLFEKCRDVVKKGH